MLRRTTTRWLIARIAILTISTLAAPLPGAAAPKYQCKPAITGYGADANKMFARREAKMDWYTKASALYGKSATYKRVIITDSCVPKRGGVWACTYTAQPCLSALAPSASKPILRTPRPQRIRPQHVRPLVAKPMHAVPMRAMPLRVRPPR